MTATGYVVDPPWSTHIGTYMLVNVQLLIATPPAAYVPPAMEVEKDARVATALAPDPIQTHDSNVAFRFESAVSFPSQPNFGPTLEHAPLPSRAVVRWCQPGIEIDKERIVSSQVACDEHAVFPHATLIVHVPGPGLIDDALGCRRSLRSHAIR